MATKIFLGGDMAMVARHAMAMAIFIMIEATPRV